MSASLLVFIHNPLIQSDYPCEGIDCHPSGLSRLNEVVHHFEPRAKDIEDKALRVLASAVLLERLPLPVQRVLHRRCMQVQLTLHMLQDDLWKPQNDLRGPLEEFNHWMHTPPHPLMVADPDRVRHLDEAVLMDAIHPRLKSELVDYEDFCAFHATEAAQYGLEPEDHPVSIRQWMRARQRARPQHPITYLGDRLEYGYRMAA